MAHRLSPAEALPILAARGLAPGPDGFAPRDLVAFAEGRGWGTVVARTAAAAPTRRWRATVFVPPGPGAPGQAHRVRAGGVTRHGGTEGEALAFALASVLRREG